MILSNMWRTAVGDGNLIYHCKNDGIEFTGWVSAVSFGTLTLIGNATSSNTVGQFSIGRSAAGQMTACVFNGLVIYGQGSTANGFYINAVLATAKFINANIHDHTAYDLAQNSSGRLIQFDFQNPVAFATVQPSVAGSYWTCSFDSWIRVSGIGQNPANFKSWLQYGIIENDAAYYRTAAPAQKVTPISASFKHEAGSKRFKVDPATAMKISCYIRKSSVAHGGANYNGNQPRLILKANPILGIATDTVLSTCADSNLDSWVQLVGTINPVAAAGVLEVTVDLDGTSGFLNVDDWELALAA
jgi:hypothetical protein